MSQANPNIYDVHYTRCNAKSQSAARIVRYLRRRPLEKENPGPESEWRELGEDQQLGDPEAFKAEAQRRKNERLRSAEERGKDISQDHSPKNVSYVHVVLSPNSREQFNNEDFGSLLEPWLRDEQGRMHEHYGAIHYDDPEGPKIHLVVARDRIHKTRELPRMKEQTAEIIREREELHEQARHYGRHHEQDPQQDRDHEPDTEKEEPPMETSRRYEDQHPQQQHQERQQKQHQREEETERRDDDRHEDARHEREVEPESGEPEGEDPEVAERRRKRLEREREELEHENEQEM